MHVYGHVEDAGLPIEALNEALRPDRVSLILVSDTAEVDDEAETEAVRASKLFVLTPNFHGAGFPSSTFDVDTVARQVSTALILARTEFPQFGWLPSPRLGWIFSDLPATRLRSSMMLAMQGNSLVPSEFLSEIRSKTLNRARLELLQMRHCAVLMQIGRGMSDSAIARELAISILRVRQLIEDLYRILSVSSRAEAGAYYLRFRDQIVAHRKSLINDSSSISR